MDIHGLLWFFDASMLRTLQQMHTSTNHVITKSFNNFHYINPTALRKAKIVCNFGLAECNRVNTLHSM